MKIAIIGAGNVGRALGTAWRTGGHDVTLGVRNHAANPLSPDFSTFEVRLRTSGAEQVAGWASGARVCKAMNQIGAPMMNHPQPAGLVGESGFETADAGELALARLLEPCALPWIQLALRRGLGTSFGFGLLRGRV